MEGISKSVYRRRENDRRQFMKKRKNAAIIISFLAVLFISACSYLPSINDDADGDVVEDEKIRIKNTEEAIDKSSAISDPFCEGTLNYRITDCQVYQSLQEAGISQSDICDPANMYSSSEDSQQYQEFSDYLTPDGGIVESHRLLVLSLNIQNVDAVGLEKKDEFLINSILLYGGENEDVSVYSPVYFSEAGKVDPGNEAHVFHYKLEQGENMDVRLGYFVLEKDVESLKGAFGGTDQDIQFNIW